MYAIIENGGKQYKAIEGGYIEIDLLPEEVGKKKTFDKVLLLSTEEKVEVGEPYIKGVSVDATIISHFKAPKVIVFKYRAKQRYRVKTGHRQQHSRVLIDSIAFPGKTSAKKKTSEPAEPAKKTATVKKTTTAKKPAATAKKSTTTAKKPAAKSTTAAKKSTNKKSTAAKKSSSADKK